MKVQDSGFGIQDSEFAKNSGSKSKAGLTQPLIPNPAFSIGFTLIEFIVAISIVVVIAGMFLVRIPFYQEQAEMNAMQQVEDAIQNALLLRYGEMMAHNVNSKKELDSLVTDNPINWLQQPLPNYKGEYYDPSPRTVAPGNWMFDLKSRDLIYVVDRSANFVSGKKGYKWIRFHVRLGYEFAQARPDAGDGLVATQFAPTEPYLWFD